ncbi:uncharacterized protein [Triticum aestivum]|uniref:uncharacterized protein n=1 Tax=Triticum aestivum TaxID=4565 RepID=UPI001D02D068|nr:uncharacterized protein LOC123046335 [Triticum aestivum]
MMMFGVDLNMSPRQDDDWELEEPEEQEEPDLNWLPQEEQEQDMNWTPQEELDLHFIPQEQVPDLNWNPQEEQVPDLNWLPQEEQDMNWTPQEEQEEPDLHFIPQEQVSDLNWNPQEEQVPDLNLFPQEEQDMNWTPQEEQEEPDLHFIPQEQVSDLNWNPQEEQVPDLNLFPQEEEVQLEGAQHPKSRELTNKERFGVYFALKVIKNKDGQVVKTDKKLVADVLKTSLSTVSRIWRRANRQIARGEEVDVSNQKKRRVGRKPKDLDLSRMATIPLNRRRTFRSLARSLGVSCTTLHARFVLGELRRNTNKLRPTIKPANEIERLRFCISMADENWLRTPWPLFRELDDIVYMDEKWFNLTQEENGYLLLPEEPDPLRTLHHKDSIAKVMFLAAVAKPRYGNVGVVTFDGKIGIWAFVTESPAQRRSENRERGTLELKSLKVTRDVMRLYMCEKLIPAIHDLWPDEDEERTIFIQQDNATPHLKPSDEVFRRAVEQTGLDIKLIQQPPNSPDLNILDLCFFRSLQSHTDCRAPQSIRELIEGVEEEYQNYDVNTLARSFVTLQSCMREIMREKGGIGYKIPHMQKERRQQEGRLPIALSLNVELVEQTLALIAAADLEAAAAAPLKQRKRKRSSSTFQAEKGKEDQQHPPSSSTLQAVAAPPPPSKQRKRKKSSSALQAKKGKEAEKGKGAIPCVPAKVVFSRIMEAVCRPVMC